MAQRKKRHKEKEKKPVAELLSFHVDDAIVEARMAIDEGLLEYLNSRPQIVGEKENLASVISEGLLVSERKGSKSAKLPDKRPTSVSIPCTET